MAALPLELLTRSPGLDPAFRALFAPVTPPVDSRIKLYGAIHGEWLCTFVMPGRLNVDQADARIAERVLWATGLARDEWQFGPVSTDMSAPGCTVRGILTNDGREVAILRETRVSAAETGREA